MPKVRKWKCILIDAYRQRHAQCGSRELMMCFLASGIGGIQEKERLQNAKATR